MQAFFKISVIFSNLMQQGLLNRPKDSIIIENVVFQEMLMTRATYYLVRALVALVAIPFHEAGHALAARLLGTLPPSAKAAFR